jgi:hypothetical protein
VAEGLCAQLGSSVKDDTNAREYLRAVGYYLLSQDCATKEYIIDAAYKCQRHIFGKEVWSKKTFQNHFHEAFGGDVVYTGDGRLCLADKAPLRDLYMEFAARAVAAVEKVLLGDLERHLQDYAVAVDRLLGLYSRAQGRQPLPPFPIGAAVEFKYTAYGVSHHGYLIFTTGGRDVALGVYEFFKSCMKMRRKPATLEIPPAFERAYSDLANKAASVDARLAYLHHEFQYLVHALYYLANQLASRYLPAGDVKCLVGVLNEERRAELREELLNILESKKAKAREEWWLMEEVPIDAASLSTSLLSREAAVAILKRSAEQAG